MFVFIDESGIHKDSGYSVFALVYITVENHTEFETAIIAIEKELNIDGFHWSSVPWVVREKFLEKLLTLEFKAKVGIVKNPIHPEEELERILPHMLIESRIRTIYIDGKKPKIYARRMKKVLRDKGVSTKKLQMVRDEQYAGVRAADAIAGLTRAYFDGKPSQKIEKWYDRFRKKKIILVLQ